MRAVLRLMLIGATIVGLMAFFLNNEYGQHIVADFFSLFRGREVEQQASEFTKTSRAAEQLALESRRQQEEFQQLLSERQSLYESRIEQMQATKEKLQAIKDGASTSDMDSLKSMISKFRETDNRWRNMGIKVQEKQESLRQINERTRNWIAKQKEKQRDLIEKAQTDLQESRQRAQDLNEKVRDRASSQQEALRSRMEALKDRMNR